MIVSIDPGNNGGIAFLGVRDAQLLSIHSMPLLETASKGRSRWMLDSELVGQLLDLNRPSCAILERVASRPGQGVAGMFAFGRSFGALEGVCGALGVPVTYVAPVVWKRHYGLLKQPKKASLELARELYPEAELHLAKHEGRAESILIGRYKIEQWRESYEW